MIFFKHFQQYFSILTIHLVTHFSQLQLFKIKLPIWNWFLPFFFYNKVLNCLLNCFCFMRSRFFWWQSDGVVLNWVLKWTNPFKKEWSHLELCCLLIWQGFIFSLYIFLFFQLSLVGNFDLITSKYTYLNYFDVLTKLTTSKSTNINIYLSPDSHMKHVTNNPAPTRPDCVWSPPGDPH